jgi:TRAP-type C4-dicarboxylate transport system permease small subunit
MNEVFRMLAKAGWLLTTLLRGAAILLAIISGLAILAMMASTCVDVVLRAFRHPLAGVYDIVKITGVIAITCALPYTTAVKGHVAIEYFFQKLSRKYRIVVDTLARSLGIALFAALAKQSAVYAVYLKDTNQVTSTLQIPVFWIPYVIAASCGIVAMVIVYNLFHPGRGMMKP